MRTVKCINYTQLKKNEGNKFCKIWNLCGIWNKKQYKNQFGYFFITSVVNIKNNLKQAYHI